MHSVQPFSLTNAELCHYADLLFNEQNGLPIAWQQELLKRFTQITYPTADAL